MRQHTDICARAQSAGKSTGRQARIDAPEHEVLGNPQGEARNPQGEARIDAPEHEVLGNPQ